MIKESEYQNYLCPFTGQNFSFDGRWDNSVHCYNVLKFMFSNMKIIITLIMDVKAIGCVNSDNITITASESRQTIPFSRIELIKAFISPI